jgi:uncharacterized protein YcfJ
MNSVDVAVKKFEVKSMFVKQTFNRLESEERKALHVESRYLAITKYPLNSDPAATGTAVGAIIGTGVGKTTGEEVGTIVAPSAVSTLAILP